MNSPQRGYKTESVFRRFICRTFEVFTKSMLIGDSLHDTNSFHLSSIRKDHFRPKAISPCMRCQIVLLIIYTYK